MKEGSSRCYRERNERKGRVKVARRSNAIPISARTSREPTILSLPLTSPRTISSYDVDEHVRMGGGEGGSWKQKGSR